MNEPTEKDVELLRMEAAAKKRMQQEMGAGNGAIGQLYQGPTQDELDKINREMQRKIYNARELMRQQVARFSEWAKKNGFDIANTYDGYEIIFLSPQTKELFLCWLGAQEIEPEKVAK